LGTLGGLAGGYVLDRFGTATTFGMVALAMLVASGALLVPTRPARSADAASSRASVGEPAEQPGSTSGRPSKRQGINLGRSMTLLTRNRLLAVLALAIILAEIFGFASQTLLPTFARDVFVVGASGLGTMMAVRSGGGAMGLLILSRLGAEGRPGLVFLVGAGAFGLSLFLFAVSPVYALALILLAISGLCASIMDTLGQTLIQRNADEHERGTAMGIWVFSVGFGPVGHLALGAAATQVGAPLAQAVSGLSLVVVAAVMALHAPLRRAR
jgi:predicted MFS family arabinose efflux permease